MALAQWFGLIVVSPRPVDILVKTVHECILDCLEGTDKIWANRGSMDLRNHGVALDLVSHALDMSLTCP